MYTLLTILYGILFQEEAGKALDIAFASLSKKGVIHLAIGYATEVRRLVNGLAARIGVLEQDAAELRNQIELEKKTAFYWCKQYDWLGFKHNNMMESTSIEYKHLLQVADNFAAENRDLQSMYNSMTDAANALLEEREELIAENARLATVFNEVDNDRSALISEVVDLRDKLAVYQS
jgi:hypothetical protein